MNILTATFCNPHGDSVFVTTDDCGSVMIALPPHEDNTNGGQESYEVWVSEGGITSEYTTPTVNPIELGRQAIAEVLPPDLLAACQSYLSLIKDRNMTPLLNALFAWQLTVQVTAQAGSSDFPSVPCSFNDVFNECVPQLQILLLQPQP